ncbi:MAG: response regulator [Proteobacteria bacterium]|nr:response regulator [Pseudomonadota bacterium]MBU1610483.1 response regulator [Pseudomonadota bacterium]
MKGGPITILLIEDNEAHAELVMRGFKDHRIINRIKHVSDGEAGLDYLMRRNEYTDPQTSPTPHLILLDLRLPKVDGLEVLRVIKSTEAISSIPVVVLTTSEAERDVAQAYKHHANSYLVKPVEFTNFTKLMDDLGFYWLAWNHRN